ncbi:MULTISPECIES: NAD-dependent epimerase/dehydratase family protein [unclassified Arthrobacter]|uniref:NAD-dependent epimerase/dehydratase family protein n=1 Tax=unclassified Arthrobacter TaxID=235627 RepID=UPI001E40B7BC|nr:MULTISPECIES: NAD-dependent epimerase/dehydratase family protein [unclassified Arthrobacter]MCC9146546.1 NAD-dependent epimerase/dehydratase family protein [Arthrobacter sp. zg-Y919]MDK1277776.1 NAD-dependent epimerase/dehydratase family protein [Arthrobacter sp. zg.Y919]WIB02269.1 NAD-dependent epimerase/dehydratase family protein [Arthrobacter sp. zg-Y919]
MSIPSAPSSSADSISSPDAAAGSAAPVWVVLGASGFIGSAIHSALSARGISVRPVPAPRLRAEGTDAAALLHQAADAERNLLADAFAGAEIVINAAGLATPGATDSPELRGANSLLPLVAADAADAAGVRRFVHLSSAAVQGHRPFLDESPHVEPFSAYSRSKALGEQVLSARKGGSGSVVTVRATSVQGPGRATTAKLARLAASPLASVAAPGTAPSPVSSVDSLVDFVLRVASHQGPVPAVVLQPWEQASVSSVLEAAGGRRPAHLPAWFCRLALRAGYAVSSLAGERLHGPLRRVELMWFGQRQEPGWAELTGNVPEARVQDVLAASRG